MAEERDEGRDSIPIPSSAPKSFPSHTTPSSLTSQPGTTQALISQDRSDLYKSKKELVAELQQEKDRAYTLQEEVREQKVEIDELKEEIEGEQRRKDEEKKEEIVIGVDESDEGLTGSEKEEEEGEDKTTYQYQKETKDPKMQPITDRPINSGSSGKGEDQEDAMNVDINLYDQRIKELECEIQQKDDEILGFKEQLEKNSEQLGSLEKKLSNEESKVKDLENERNELKAEIGKITSNNEYLQKKVNKNEEEVGKLNDNKTQKENEINVLNKEIEQKKKELNIKIAEVKTLQTEYKTNFEKIEKDYNEKIEKSKTKYQNKRNDLNEVLRKCTVSYNKYFKKAKSLQKDLSATRKQYSYLQQKVINYTAIIRDLKLLREKDVENYFQLREEYQKLSDSYSSLCQQSQIDTSQYNKLREEYSSFKNNVEDQVKLIFQDHEHVVTSNDTLIKKHLDTLNEKISENNKFVAQEWTKNSDAFEQNIQFIHSLKNEIRNINQKSESNIKDFKEVLNYLGDSVKEEFSQIIGNIPKITEEYINFLAQKQASLANIHCKLDDQENLIAGLNNKIHEHNTYIQNDVQSKKHDLSQKIEITNIKLSALNLIQNQVENKVEECKKL